MPVEERRRVELRNVVTSAWGEEAADTLFDLMAPSGHELATRQDIEALRRDMDHRFDRMDARFDALEHRLLERFERRIADAVTSQTRTLVFSQLGALLAIAAIAFGLR